MKYDEKEINNLCEFFTRLKEDIKPEFGPVWYRGNVDSNWELLPMIYRHNYSKDEMDFLKEFKQNATLLLQLRQYQPYEWLFIMRHYGIPTRLLDWTESPISAVFFAIDNQKNDTEDGAIWMLEPLELNNNIPQPKGDQSLPAFEEDDVMGPYRPENFSSTAKDILINPIAFITPRIQPRMQSQQSVFTIHHNVKTEIDKIGTGSHIWKYKIPKSSKKTFHDELKLLKISKFELFPELESIQYKIMEK